ncbi:hypothetical protein lacNasYZ03_11710 [Lactobacillus nasalidis]|uniref:DUF806 family protein n=1 Tax=Lactobacillus nasalidis TaxID=2797258 RepID=A0ABQ3W813_9LACO|nr:hypothetical protein [Lactobacillus nasalidis]GHV97895.1 hypothetical protein lacNasYZ01_10770 [Lactobacillus nasalidis]GHW00125.1 hypothetical protein lacNasYZ02_15540 [Lactobacillus nasalidis]GHW01484.1 hypothetical protein lacNasYZ03_11710 [Lactobacillus nasalidis]
MIYDVKALVYSTLDSISDISGHISPRYPDEMTEFPCVVYSTQHESVFKDADQKEQLTEWTFTVDIFGEGSLDDISSEIIGKFEPMGFKYTAVDQDLSDISRIGITFRGVVDNDSLKVYEN